MVECPKCGGFGKVPVPTILSPDASPAITDYVIVVCPLCHGKETVSEEVAEIYIRNAIVIPCILIVVAFIVVVVTIFLFTQFG